MNPERKTNSHWLRRFLLLTFAAALLHYSLFITANTALFDTMGQKLNFFTALVLPLVGWTLSMPAQTIAHSDFCNQLGPIAFSLIWVLNSFVWGLLLGAVITWIWRRREELPFERKS